MTDRPSTQLSLRRFRETIADLRDPVEVSRRDSDGSMRILGAWTPYPQSQTEAKPLELPLDDEPVAPKVIKTPQEVAAVVRVDPVRAVPKPSQMKRGK